MKKMYPTKLVNMYPNTPLFVLREQGLITYTKDGKPIYTQKGYKLINK